MSLVFETFLVIPENGPADGLKIVPAHQQREWMTDYPLEEQHDPEKIERGMGNRCLPMLMVNQIGWDVVNTQSFMATSMPDGRVIYHWETPRPRVGCPQSNFKGGNLLTWQSPWTFQTPEGWDLMILPPPNTYLPTGATCLSALVETDHIPAAFTFNWRIEPGLSVWVKPGDVVCRLLPYRTGDLEAFSMVQHDTRHEGYGEWMESRRTSLHKLLTPGNRWERPYFREAKRLKIKRPSTD